MFPKGPTAHPVLEEYICLTHCAVSPLHPAALSRQNEFAEKAMRHGLKSPDKYDDALDSLRRSAAGLMGCPPDDVAFVKNTTEGLSMIANGYPFEPGDKVIGYVNEYPANHYPWKLQESRGVEYVLLPDRNLSEAELGARPCGFSMEDLKAAADARTRIVALSHVQFASGFAADLAEIGAFCRERGIDLVVDAAQSLGCLPLEPEKLGISALAASGWKWLMGPVGTGLLYASPEFRRKIRITMAGADLMRQGEDYLDHSWNPHGTAKMFEYSTQPVTLAAWLDAAIRAVVPEEGAAAVRDEIFRLQDVFLGALDSSRFKPLLFKGSARSGILSLTCREDPAAVARAAIRRSVMVTARAGYVRIAPHVYLRDEDMMAAANIFNSLSTNKATKVL